MRIWNILVFVVLGFCKVRGSGWHLVGVWIGGVWNGHFPESEKDFSEA